MSDDDSDSMVSISISEIIYVNDTVPVTNVDVTDTLPRRYASDQDVRNLQNRILFSQLVICWTLFSINIYVLVDESSHYINELCSGSSIRQYLIVGAVQYYIQAFYCTPDPSLTRKMIFELVPWILVVNLGLLIWGICIFAATSCVDNLINTKTYIMTIIQTIDLILVCLYQTFNLIYISIK